MFTENWEMSLLNNYICFD